VRPFFKKKNTMTTLNVEEQKLLSLTEEALRETTKREPTRQEIMKVHAGFKRMAFLLLDYIDHYDQNQLQEEENSSSSSLT
jgi:hypothetical protein